MAKELRGPCGVNCLDCDVYQATITDDDELRKKCYPSWKEGAKKYWGIDLKIEDVNCNGCTLSDYAIFSPRHCPMAACAKKKNLTSCGHCPDWKTCDWMVMLHKDFPDAREYLLNQE